MEVFLYNSTVCRLCGEENDSGTLLYSPEENTQNLSEIINTYLPIKVSDDGQLPRTICPGCTIQLEATVEFLNLIINGQKIIRELYQREKEYKKTVFKAQEGQEDVNADHIVYDISVNSNDGIYHEEHPISLQVSGLERPKRKRGRPPKKPKSPEEIAKETAARESELAAKEQENKEEVPGKRRRKTPNRFKEAVQGKELERIFKEEGVTDGDDSENETKPETDVETKLMVPKEPEIIGHMETSGELVVVVKGKGRGRPKGRMRPTRSLCAICGAEFSCVGRYMSHVAQHGPVLYRCACAATFATRVAFTQHQLDSAHQGQTVIACAAPVGAPADTDEAPEPAGRDPLLLPPDLPEVPMTALPDLGDKAKDDTAEFIKSLVSEKEPASSEVSSGLEEESKNDEKAEETVDDSTEVIDPKGKVKLKCPHCDKMFSSKQSKSMHIKAVHQGEKPYVCGECGVRFAYPRSLALHALSHRRQRAPHARRFACDLCGKVLNHPSSVVYHKEAEHAGQRYVCNKCGKSFKHKQLLQRHQLVHSQLRPYSCKLHFSDNYVEEIPAKIHYYVLVNTLDMAYPDARLQVHKQISLLVNDKNQQQTVEVQQDTEEHDESSLLEITSVPSVDNELEERVIYVTYDVDESEPAFHILDPEQAVSLDDSKVLTTCELYSGPSLLVSQPELEALELEQEELPPEQLQMESDDLELAEPLELGLDEHIAVTDEQGNPLHFTMQDGTQLAITSSDGKSLQVITQDGQTIPVEINGFNGEEEVEEETETITQINLSNSVVDDNMSSPVTHYFTIV
ncbi:zinc finger protein 236-like [Hyposmocoma kahamanoa]|uniref:zinc finger protein 236-like n=1 Tax=Hyposmocoma kahamanoa TaxID=1477025 RepID=UPI000E6D7017|nr:zinc finger protein 236-like [Hyposmocoma kahamanoa]